MACSWTANEIHLLVEQKLGKWPCWFQIQIALTIYQKKDIVATAATGSGKTLSFWIPILMVLEDGEDVTEFIITPLNILGKQQIQDLETAGIKAIAVSNVNVNARTFKVCHHILIIENKQLE
jgi:ATP-dependent helicase YprA (DUF1998 family)